MAIIFPKEIARELNIDFKTVNKWCCRWHVANVRLFEAELKINSPKELKEYEGINQTNNK